MRTTHVLGAGLGLTVVSVVTALVFHRGDAPDAHKGPRGPSDIIQGARKKAKEARVRERQEAALAIERALQGADGGKNE